MSYPTFQDRYGAGATAPATAPQGAGGVPDPQQSAISPWAQILQSQNEMSKRLDPWALDAKNQNPQMSQSSGAKNG